MTETFILSVLGILFGGGTIAALIGYWSNRRRNAAETDNFILEGAKSLLEPLTDRVTCLEADLKRERMRRIEVEESREKEIKAMSEELEQVRQEAARRSEEYNRRIKDLETAVTGKDAEIAKLQAEAETLKQQVAKQFQQIEALEAQLEELKQTPVTKLQGTTVITKRKTGPLKESRE